MIYSAELEQGKLSDWSFIITMKMFNIVQVLNTIFCSVVLIPHSIDSGLRIYLWREIVLQEKRQYIVAIYSCFCLCMHALMRKNQLNLKQKISCKVRRADKAAAYYLIIIYYHIIILSYYHIIMWKLFN